MAKERILVPHFVEAKIFEALERNGIEMALLSCKNEGYRALYMPEIIDTRLSAKNDSYIWQDWFTAPSISVTGRTKGGKAVVVYAHVENYFSDPMNIKIAREQGLINGKGIMTKNEFYRILGLEDGKTVFVVDYGLLSSSESGLIKVSKAFRHPQTIPFLGGKERAEQYLKRHAGLYGNEIGIWHYNFLGDVPLGCVLFVLDDFCGDCGGLFGGYFSLSGEGRFVGVAAEPQANKIGTLVGQQSHKASTSSALDDRVKDTLLYVPPIDPKFRLKK